MGAIDTPQSPLESELAVDPDQIIEFVTTWPSRIAAISVARPDGTTSTVPVWYRYDNGALLIWTERSRAWPTHLINSGHASFCIAEDVHPYRAVTGRGPGVVLTDGEIDVDREIRLIVARYIHPDLAETYIAKWSHLRDIARIEASHVSGWSLGY